MRTDVDYGDMSTVDEQDARDAYSDAERFVYQIDSLRQTLIRELKEKTNTHP